MILRLWSSRYRADATDEFEELVRDKLFPKFREHGCLSFYSAADRTKNPPEMVIVSLWENMEAIEKMGGGSSDRKVILPESAQYIVGEPATRHFQVFFAK